MADPTVSIIIPTRNGERDIEKCLTGIFAQDNVPLYEVIVIDSGSSDDTLNIVRKFPVNLTEIKPHEFGHGKTRNLGASLAKGKYLVYLTQDAIPANGRWLQKLVRNLDRDDKVAGVYSRWLPRADADPLEAGWIWHTFTPIKETRGLDGLSPEDCRTYMPRMGLFSDVSSSIRKAVWEEIPFDETLTFGEDQQWARNALEAGHSIVYEPESIVYHSHRYSITEYFKKSFDKGRSFKKIANTRHSLLAILASIPLGWTTVHRSGFRASSYRLIYASMVRVFGAIGESMGSHDSFIPKVLKRRISTMPQHFR